MREDIIRKTEKFLWENLMKSVNFEGNSQRSVEYRFEHSWRVANIGREIAEREGFDVERMFVACLLHDVGYSVEMKDENDYKNHGRYGARIARPFLLEIGYGKEEVEEMCYGIAIHVDDEADFAFERTPFSMTVGAADNIDRFDAYRLYENLQLADYANLPLSEQEAFIQKRVSGLERLRKLEFATKTADKLWKEKIDFQLDFMRKLKNQIDNSTIKSIFK